MVNQRAQKQLKQCLYLNPLKLFIFINFYSQVPVLIAKFLIKTSTCICIYCVHNSIRAASIIDTHPTVYCIFLTPSNGTVSCVLYDAAKLIQRWNSLHWRLFSLWLRLTVRCAWPLMTLSVKRAYVVYTWTCTKLYRIHEFLCCNLAKILTWFILW